MNDHKPLAMMHDEYDFSSLGRKFSVRRTEQLPHRTGFGEYEKRQFMDDKVTHVSHEVANAILNDKMIEVRRSPDEVTITCDFVVIDMAEYYKMLEVIKSLTGSTRVRTVR